MPFQLAPFLSLMLSQSPAVAVVFAFMTLMMFKITLFMSPVMPVLAVIAIVAITVIVRVLIALSISLLNAEAEQCRSTEHNPENKMSG